MRKYTFSLSLRIKHPSQDLEEVCNKLKLTPSVIWKEGEERLTPKGRSLGGTRKNSYCSIKFPTQEEGALPEKLQQVLSVITPHRRTLRQVVASGGQVSFFVGLFCDRNFGETIEWSTLMAMADLRISLELDIYPPDSDHDDSEGNETAN